MEPSSSPPSTRHWAEPDRLRYRHWVERRRALDLPGYASFADVGLDGDWTTPYHLASCALDGPVLLTYNYLDAPSARAHRETLLRIGFLPDMPFNRVLDRPLGHVGLGRSDLYVTHAFHMLPAARSTSVPRADLDRSFDMVGRLECEGRRVIALGRAAAHLCRRHGIAHVETAHPSARGLGFAERAAVLAAAIR
ncbi:hypothetical protein SAMN06295905_1829 [Devosia lucknowensis]|uniref:Uncharacterized protein n=1 Tax=Devosia lucknowensis TaxID=1096929 RepID=A0A1Y6F6L9_9HYPH|nr:hypothetical protein [Devosia lucknowensis]SMQ70209.1 hypothetical protein SAMN06295905_1829 [Devosia lucknowensis]